MTLQQQSLRAPSAVVVVSSLAIALTAGLLVSQFPALFVLPAAFAFLLVLLQSPSMQLLTVVAGALFVLGSTETGLTPAKFLYLGALALCVLLALVPNKAGGQYAETPTVLLGSAFYLAVSALNSLFHGVSTVTWVRASFALVFIILAIPLASYYSARISLPTIEFLLVVFGALSLLGTLSKWATARGVADITLPTSLAPTPWPALVLCAYSLSSFIYFRKQMRWLLIFGCTFGGLLLTGTRGILVLFLGLFTGAILVTVRTRSMNAYGRTIFAVVTLAILVAMLIATLSALHLIQLQSLFHRLSTLTQPSTLTNTDLSGISRIAQAKVAWRMFLSAPVAGLGIGIPYNYTYYSSIYRSLLQGTSMDSPVAFLAEQGVIGVGYLLWLGHRFRDFIRNVVGTPVDNFCRVFLYMICGCFIAALPLQHIFSDRGFGIAVILALTTIVCYARNKHLHSGSAGASLPSRLSPHASTSNV